MRTTYDKTFMTDWDILTYDAYNNGKLLCHKCDKCPFLPPELEQNIRNMQKILYYK